MLGVSVCGLSVACVLVCGTGNVCMYVQYVCMCVVCSIGGMECESDVCGLYVWCVSCI